MKKDELRERFTELLTLHPPLAEIDKLFEKALDSGALEFKQRPDSRL